ARRWVPTSSVAPVSGSATVTTRPGSAAVRRMRPLAGTGTMAAGGPDGGRVAMLQPWATFDSVSDTPARMGIRIMVPEASTSVLASANVGSFFSAARSIGRRSSNTTRMSRPRRKAAAPASGESGTTKPRHGAPADMPAGWATRATGPRASPAGGSATLAAGGGGTAAGGATGTEGAAVVISTARADPGGDTAAVGGGMVAGGVVAAAGGARGNAGAGGFDSAGAGGELAADFGSNTSTATCSPTRMSFSVVPAVTTSSAAAPD